MADKPIILAVDDDPDVLQAIAHDVRHGFGEHFRVMRAESGDRALEVLRRLRLADEPVALLLVDQRMPGLSGIDFLVQAMRLYPDAKTALLTAYADTDVAITAINEVRLDHYLVKPWDPPEQRLFPVLDELLEDWTASHPPTFSGIRVIGHRWSLESHTARDFLARNQVPYRWLDLASDPEASELLELTGRSADRCPILVLPDGQVLEAPTTQEIAEKVGLGGHPEVPLYDLIIIGAGPAGLAAAVYGASEGLSTLVIEGQAAGGQAGQSSRIENYLGFPNGLSGADLSRRALTQAKRFGAELLLAREVTSVTPHPGALTVTLSDASTVRAHSVVIATGVAYNRLPAPGVEEFTGRGVYYGAAMSEAATVKGEDVYIVGAANSAGQAAIYLSTLARRVTMLVRGAEVEANMSHYLADRIRSTDNIEVRCNATIAEVRGTDHLEEIVVHDSINGETSVESATDLFVFIGAAPRTNWLDGSVVRDEHGFITTGPALLAGDGPRTWREDRDPYLLETSIPGVFAAGDVRRGSAKRVATAVGEGASAVLSVWQYRAGQGL